MLKIVLDEAAREDLAAGPDEIVREGARLPASRLADETGQVRQDDAAAHRKAARQL
jgi:hypothetical protein